MADDDRGRWALLVGIDRYPRFGRDVQLAGCVNDVQILRDALIRRFGFSEERMTVLLNEQATRDGILAAMEELAGKVGEDDVVVFHFSGHGSQQTDGPEADEGDGWDETLVPFDSGRAPWKNRDIADDEIHDWLLRLTARTPYVTLIIDSCHSGTVVRGANIRQVCRDTRPWDELAVSASRVGRIPGRPVLRGVDTDGPSGWLPLGEKYVLLAACASAETASEILVGEPEAVPHGALTYFVVQELMSPDFTGATYRELCERLTPRVKARCLLQNPQVEGARDREIFGVQHIRPMPFLSVRSRDGGTVVLDAGGACGLTVGSEWEVYAQGTRSVQDEARRIGRVAITAVRATFSEARILEERTDRIQAGARAVETVARLGGVASLRNDASPLHGQVDLVLHRLEGGRCLPPESDANGEPVFDEGDHVVLEIRNRSARPVYFYVLDIGLTGKVVQVHPPEGSHEPLEAGSTVRVGEREGDERLLFIPPDFELLHPQSQGGRLQGRETVKLFVTTSPAQFDILFNPGYRFRTGEEDWTTVERSFWVRGRRKGE